MLASRHTTSPYLSRLCDVDQGKDKAYKGVSFRHVDHADGHDHRADVYRTSQAIRGADRSGIGKAIGEQLAGSSVGMIALVDKDGKVESSSTWASTTSQKIPSYIPSLRTYPKAATVLKGGDLSEGDSNIRSLLVLPLSQVDETLIIASRSRTGFSGNDIRNYQTIAEQVALSLENLKLLEQAHQMGITKERERLAAEIHDSLTQGFISIVIHLEIAEAKMPHDLLFADRHNSLDDVL